MNQTPDLRSKADSSSGKRVLSLFVQPNAELSLLLAQDLLSRSHGKTGFSSFVVLEVIKLSGQDLGVPGIDTGKLICVQRNHFNIA